MAVKHTASTALLLLLLSRGAFGFTPQIGFNDTYRTTDICGEVGVRGPTNSTGCSTILLLASVIFSWNPSWDNLICDAYSDDIDLGVNVSAEGKSLPSPLQDMRPVPLQISRSRWESEGANYYWMFRNIMNFAIYSPCYADGNTSTISGNSSNASGKHAEIPVPPVWDLINTVIIPETKDGAEDDFGNPGNALPVPFAWVITQGNMMVILVRSLISKYEWMIDFDYAFTDPDKVDPRLEGMGGIHAGFSKLALQVFDELQPILVEQVVKGPIHYVSISAYSRGAGIGTFLSYLVQKYINEAVPGLTPIQVDAYLFAPPNAGIQKAQPGGVHFGPGMMPYQSDNWRCFETLDTRQAFGFLSATHSCSYLCAFSSFVNVTNNNCLLSSEGADLSVASFSLVDQDELEVLEELVDQDELEVLEEQVDK
eukprot:gene1395-32764_t